MLPSVALLEIFGSYLSTYNMSWHTLVHVCRRWRNVVFRWSRHLNVEISCSFVRPVRATLLDIWPPLPINISGSEYYSKMDNDVDNIVAALEHKDRVCKISLRHVTSWNLEKILTLH